MNGTLALSWDAHQNNICKGLSLLQQRGEFVDMTLAADGHHVKVHQLVLSLASPYIKDLISSAQCPHPIVFLNNIKYTTLCAILEYVYTGETRIDKETLPELITAGKALHINGLENMEDPNTTIENIKDVVSSDKDKTSQNSKIKNELQCESKLKILDPTCGIFVDTDDDGNEQDMETEDAADSIEILDTNFSYSKEAPDKIIKYKPSVKLQYTISNQGNLQIIVNRHIYYLKYVKKNLIKYWRCVDSYGKTNCPANVYTNEKNQLVKRKGFHTHSFHDQKILKKNRLGLIFEAYDEALEARTKKAEENVQDDTCTE